jgi:hypothetical protein
MPWVSEGWALAVEEARHRNGLTPESSQPAMRETTPTTAE